MIDIYIVPIQAKPDIARLISTHIKFLKGIYENMIGRVVDNPVTAWIFSIFKS